MKLAAMLTAAAIGMVPVTAALAQDVPEGYPADYAQVIDGAKAEGKVLIYSNMSIKQWTPFLDLAKERYPWLTIETGDMGDEMWEKYYAESSSGVETADIMLTNSMDRWPVFVDRGENVDYTSPEKPALPDWSIPYPGVYSVSVDPFIMAYNKFLIKEDEVPHSWQAVVDLLKKHPELDGKITAVDPNGNASGLGAFYALTKARPETWDILKTLGPSMRPERGAATVREKLMSGEYAVAILTSGGGIPTFEQPEVKALTGWLFPEGGVPANLRNIAITKGAKHPNAAKLVLDLILSHDGQIAMGKGGQTPYRADVKGDEVPYISYNTVKEQVGEDNIIVVRPDAAFVDERPVFLDKWAAAMKGE